MRCAWLLVGVVACAAPKTETKLPVTAQTSLAFSTPATHYNGPTDPPLSSSLADMVIKEVRDTSVRLGKTPPVLDERLYLVSAALAAVVPETGALPNAVIEFATQSNGIVEPSPHLLVAWGGLYDPAGGGFLQALKPELERVLRDENIARVGVAGIVRGRTGWGALVLALQTSRIQTTPIPRVIPAGGSVDFDVVTPADRITVYVMTPDGRVDLVVPTASEKGFPVHAVCGATKGRMVIQVTDAESTLANFSVWCGVEAPRSISMPALADELPKDPREAEREIIDLLNRDRLALGRPALRTDDTLGAVARAHAQEMARANEGVDRVEGVRVLARLEQLRPDLQGDGAFGIAYNVTEAHETALGLPSTRRKFLAEDVTLVGIGIAYGELVDGRREVFISEVIAAPK